MVELDSAPLRDRMDNQLVPHEQARAAQIQAGARYENQKSQNETALAADDLKSALNLNAAQTIGTKRDRPFGFTFDESRTELRTSLDLPLNRKAQRNNYCHFQPTAQPEFPPGAGPAHGTLPEFLHLSSDIQRMLDPTP